ncbi:MAG: carboxylating nicotinate-nucleotide diphosphorylase [Desulfobacteraceae bacterium]|nr:carboxylating nicotinate-nucleotide diphosphorylase [Desulfobacteraceae bacterium]
MLRMDELIRLALLEDIGSGDATTLAVVPAEKRSRAVVFSREPFVLSGSYPFRRVFELLDPSVAIEALARDGEKVDPNVPAFSLSGPAGAILTGERTALNFLQRYCGIATLTRRMADAVEGTGCRLLDTRKTTPLWRQFEKQAVLHGGGANHRFGLSDGILIKDNHIAAAGGVGEAVRRARAGAAHTLRIEVEVENLEGLEEAVSAGADIVMLDNFDLATTRRAVAAAKGRVLLEASGGVNLDTVRSIAETGVNFVSCGALTHSARAIDLTMEFYFTGSLSHSSAP